MARRLGGVVVLAAVVCAVASCGRPMSDAVGAVVDARAAENPLPWAANAGDVARFADEEPFGPTAIVTGDGTRVTRSPGGGDVVATLAAGTDVTKLSARGGEALVCFDEPKPGGRHLMGWVPQSALEDPALPSPAPQVDDGGAPPDPPPPHGGHHHHRRPHKRHP